MLFLHLALIDGFRAWLERWAPLAEWLVAIGTGGLAVATYLLARQAHQEALAVRDQVRLEAQQLVAHLGGDLSHHSILLRNLGAVAAFNVRGALYWTETAGGASSFVPMALAVGEERETKVLGEGIDPNWSSASGFLRYHDLAGAEWQTHFVFGPMATETSRLKS